MYGAVAHLFKRDHETAADWGGQTTRVPNSHYWANAVQVAALGHLGQDAEAKEARKELLRLKPTFTCSFGQFWLRCVIWGGFVGGPSCGRHRQGVAVSKCVNFGKNGFFLLCRHVAKPLVVLSIVVRKPG